MHLLLDVGNTRIKWAIVDPSVKLALGESDGSGFEGGSSGAFYAGSEPEFVAAFSQIKGGSVGQITFVGVSSVSSDAVNQCIVEAVLSVFDLAPNFASVDVVGLGVSVAYRKKTNLGVDRLLVMLAALALSRRAWVVIDAGSALTIDYINEKGEHLGGLIVPGVASMRNALVGKSSIIAERIKDVASPFLGAGGQGKDVFSGLDLSVGTLGDDTGLCVDWGVEHLLAGLVRQVVPFGEGDRGGLFSGVAGVCVTGGDACRLLPYLDSAIWDSHLVLKGLKVYFERINGVGA